MFEKSLQNVKGQSRRWQTCWGTRAMCTLWLKAACCCAHDRGRVGSCFSRPGTDIYEEKSKGQKKQPDTVWAPRCSHWAARASFFKDQKRRFGNQKKPCPDQKKLLNNEQKRPECGGKRRKKTASKKNICRIKKKNLCRCGHREQGQKEQGREGRKEGR